MNNSNLAIKKLDNSELTEDFSLADNTAIPSDRPTIRLYIGAPELSIIANIFSETHNVDIVVDGGVQNLQLIFGLDTKRKERNLITSKIQPIQLDSHVQQLDTSNRIDLHIPVLDTSGFSVRLTCNSQSGQKHFSDILEQVAGEIQRRSPRHISNNIIRFGGAPKNLIHQLSLVCIAGGLPFLESDKAWNAGDNDIWIDIQDPSVSGLPLREWLPVAILSDDNEAFIQLKAQLEEKGFQEVRRAVRGERRTDVFGFGIDPHMYKSQPNQQGELALLQNTIQQFMSDAGIELTEYPLNLSDKSQGHAAVVHLPMGAYRSGMSAYGGNAIGAFPISIYSDSERFVAPIVEQLRQANFNVAVRSLRPKEPICVVMDWGLFSTHAQASTLKDMVNNFLQTEGHAPIEPLVREQENRDIRIYLPTAERITNSRALQSRFARRYALHINISSLDPRASAIKASVEAIGFRRIRFDEDLNGPSENIIHFGGCPSPLISCLKDLFQPYCDDQKIGLEQVWAKNDRDVFVFLPSTASSYITQDSHFDIHSWLLPEEQIVEKRPFLCGSETILKVGSVTLNLSEQFNHTLTPSRSDFVHYCIDSKTAQLLQRLAEAVSAKEPVLLEGVTATSKTSSILFLAAQLGQPVLRLNLSGATDVSEFVGRFIPDESRDGNGWRWEHGPVVKAMLNGYWLILDELNLGEAAILERLNVILERQPRLVLTEYNDLYIGGSEYPVHPNFRVFATQNPDRYVGRNALSPAYRDRFYETQVADPNLDVESMHAMLKWVSFGVAPEPEIYGVQYRKDIRRPSPLELPDVPDLHEFLRCLAIFHTSLSASCSSVGGNIPAIGADRAGGYAFTRRGLMRVLTHLERSLKSSKTKSQRIHVYRQALTRVYLERVDIQAASQVADLMDAAGIGPQTWLV